MFNESDSFYYSPRGDLTNSIQRCHSRHSLPEGSPSPEGAKTSPWQRADDRFFWNRHMLQDLISSGVCITAGPQKCFILIKSHWHLI